MDIFQNLPGISGWPGTALTLLGIIAYGWYITRSAKEKSEKIANEAKDSAIKAMDAHLNVLKDRIRDAEDENIKMKHVIQTIYAALKSRGIYITINEGMINISEGKRSTTTRIQEEP